MKEMDGAGLKEAEYYITKEYLERMELWGK